MLRAQVDWCIDHENAVVYTKLAAPQPQQSPYHVAYFEVDDISRPGVACRFSATHWASGDSVHVYREDNLTCSTAYVPSQLPGADGVTNVNITVV